MMLAGMVLSFGALMVLVLRFGRVKAVSGKVYLSDREEGARVGLSMLCKVGVLIVAMGVDISSSSLPVKLGMLVFVLSMVTSFSVNFYKFAVGSCSGKVNLYAVYLNVPIYLSGLLLYMTTI